MAEHDASKCYSESAFHDLPHIDKVVPYSPQRDGACFDRLARVLAHNRREGRFLITLLHTHFPVEADECLLALARPAERRIGVQVRKTADVQPGVVPIGWRLRRIKSQTSMVPLLYTRLFAEDSQSAVAMNPSDWRCLHSIGAVLEEYSDLNRFGVGLLLEPFEIAEDQYLLEETDVASREQEFSVDSRENLDTTRSIQTSWRLLISNPAQPSSGCTTRTETSCHRWCKVTGCTRYRDGEHDPGKHRGERHTEEKRTHHHESSGGCFISSAAASGCDLPDDCMPLSVLRKFRDEVLINRLGLTSLVADYYRIAPRIVCAIESSDDPRYVYRRIFREVILPCVSDVLNGRYESAILRYTTMVCSLSSAMVVPDPNPLHRVRLLPRALRLPWARPGPTAVPAACRYEGGAGPPAAVCAGEERE